MSKIVRRNDPCPCGSGKKYKECCLKRQDEPFTDSPYSFIQSYKETRRASRIKHCLHPDKSKCSEDIINSHSIQNNKVLRRISSNGKVYMPCPKSDNPFASMTEYGRKEATVFTGFCKYHDKTLFQPIDDSDFIASDEQIFLYIYRCFAVEYHKKLEAVQMGKELYKTHPSLINKTESPFDGMKMAIRDFAIEKDVFDTAILSKKYDVLTSIIWTFDGHANFSGSGFDSPSVDMRGARIQDLRNIREAYKHTFLVVFPENNFVYAIIAWIKQNDSVFSGLYTQLNNLSVQERKNYINNILPHISENIALNPDSWSKWDSVQKSEFEYLVSLLSSFDDMFDENFKYVEKPSFDLFAL